MSNLIEHAERAEVARLEAIFEQEPQCQGVLHGTLQYGHDDGPAKYVVTFPCDAGSLLACAGRAEVFRTIGCRCDGHLHEGWELRVVEL